MFCLPVYVVFFFSAFFLFSVSSFRSHRSLLMSSFLSNPFLPPILRLILLPIPPGTHSHQTITGELRPGTSPENVRARPVSSSTVVVQWDTPRIPNGQIKGYRVFLSRNPSLPMSQWKVHEVGHSQLTTVSDLVTMVTYSIRVRTKDIGVGCITSYSRLPAYLPCLIFLS